MGKGDLNFEGIKQGVLQARSSAEEAGVAVKQLQTSMDSLMDANTAPALKAAVTNFLETSSAFIKSITKEMDQVETAAKTAEKLATAQGHN